MTSSSPPPPPLPVSMRSSLNAITKPSKSSSANTMKWLATLDITYWDGRVRVAERRRLRALRVLFELAFFALAIAVLWRLLYWASTIGALWAIPAAFALILVIFTIGRVVNAALERDVADVVGNTLFVGDIRLNARAVLSVEADDSHELGPPGVRVTCIGGGRHYVLFRGYPKSERDAAAQALRAGLGVLPVFSESDNLDAASIVTQ